MLPVSVSVPVPVETLEPWLLLLPPSAANTRFARVFELLLRFSAVPPLDPYNHPRPRSFAPKSKSPHPEPQAPPPRQAAERPRHAERQPENAPRHPDNAPRQERQAPRQAGHAARQIENAARQARHAARQTRNAACQTDNAARQIENAARQTGNAGIQKRQATQQIGKAESQTAIHCGRAPQTARMTILETLHTQKHACERSGAFLSPVCRDSGKPALATDVATGLRKAPLRWAAGRSRASSFRG